MDRHAITRVRHEVVRRTLTVARKHNITPHMLRLEFQSEDLEGFQSPSPDDHIKIFLPTGKEQEAVMRDFTPRCWDIAQKRFILDFAVHPSGPAVEWAQQARVGDTLQIGGPRGSAVVPNDFDWYLLIGDATALPSMARRLEALAPASNVEVIALVAEEAEMAYLPQGAHTSTALYTDGDPHHDLQQVLQHLATWQRPEGDGFVWIGSEASVARGVYQCATGTLAQPTEWIKAAAYWSAGEADGGASIA